MKNNIIIAVMALGVLFAQVHNVNAQDNPVLDTFNYQGELMDDNVLANGEYDFTVRAESTSQGPVGLTSEHIQVEVVNGLFLLEDVDLGANRFSDATELSLRISIRKTSVGGAYTALTQSQLLSAVPYASQLISGDATNGQVLTFDGLSWQPENLPVQPVVTTPWVVNGSDIKYNDGKVGIGIANDPQVYSLQVKTSSQFPASFEGGNNSTVAFIENGTTRGLIGSGNNIGADDFSIATPVPSTGKIHIAPQVNPVLTVTSAEFVGIGIESPTSTLHVKRTDSGVVGVFDGGNNAAITILENGSSRGFLGSLGNSVSPNDFSVGSSLNDLHLIAGAFSTPSISIKASNSETTIKGNTKQPISSNGMVKYMVSITGCGGAGVTMPNSYNGVDTEAIIVQNDSGGIGSCEIVFTENINARFAQATVIGGFNALGEGVSCRKNGLVLGCTVFNTITGNEMVGDIDVLIY